MVSLPQPAPASAVPRIDPLPLENGDAMRSGEFLRRYEAMPEVKKAELVEGRVYMGSPVRADLHAEPDGLVHLWLATFALRCRTARFYPNATVVLDADNTCQPDAVLCLAPEHGGRTRINARGYLTGAPELVAEIAASTVSLDMQEKLRVYRRCGVSEYLVWRTAEKQFDWFRLEHEEYRRLAPGADGLLRSRVFPGLVLDVGALLARDGARVLAALPLDPHAAAGHAKRG